VALQVEEIALHFFGFLVATLPVDDASDGDHGLHRIGMLGTKHATLRVEHSVQTLLCFGVLALVVEILGGHVEGGECVGMIGS